MSFGRVRSLVGSLKVCQGPVSDKNRTCLRARFFLYLVVGVVVAIIRICLGDKACMEINVTLRNFLLGAILG